MCSSFLFVSFVDRFMFGLAGIGMLHLAAASLKKKKVAEGKLEYSYTVTSEPPPRGSYSFDGSGVYFVPGQFSQGKKRKVAGTHGVDHGAEGEPSIAVSRKRASGSTKPSGSANPSASTAPAHPASVPGPVPKAAASVASRASGSARTKTTSKQPSGSGKSVRDLVNVFGPDVMGFGPNSSAEGQGCEAAEAIMLAQERVLSSGLAEDFFFKSVPASESKYSGALADNALEQRFIQRQLDVSVSVCEVSI